MNEGCRTGHKTGIKDERKDRRQDYSCGKERSKHCRKDQEIGNPAVGLDGRQVLRQLDRKEGRT